MKDSVFMVGLIFATLCLMGLVMYAASWFYQTSTAIMLNSPKPGVTCASMVTGNGVALSCWKD